MKSGDLVTQVLPAPIKGKVIDKAIDKDSDELLILVEYTNEAGEVLTRYFKESQLTAD